MSLTILDKDYLTRTIINTTNNVSDQSRTIRYALDKNIDNSLKQSFDIYRSHPTLSSVYEALNGSVLELNNGTLLYQDYSTLTGDIGQGFTYDSMVSIGASETTLKKIHQLNTKYNKFQYAGKNPFFKCRTLQYVNANNLTSFEQYTFSGNWALSCVEAQNVKTIASGTFNDCNSLKKVAFPNLISLGSTIFNASCPLEEFDLSENDNLVSLANANSFTNLTTDYQILVPAKLISQYKSASQWSTIQNHIFAK